jgi:hypothetical protein
MNSSTGDLGARGTARDTLALAVTGLIVAEKRSDQLRMNMGGGHWMSFRMNAARCKRFGIIASHSHRIKQRSFAPEE